MNEILSLYGYSKMQDRIRGDFGTFHMQRKKMEISMQNIQSINKQ